MLTSLANREYINNLNLKLSILDTQFTIIDSATGRFVTSFRRHMHSFYELHYICGGKGLLVTDSASYPLKKGDLFIVPPNCYHEQITDESDPMEEFHIAFTAMPQSNQTVFAYFLQSRELWMVKTDVPLDEMYENINRELLHHGPYLPDMLRADFLQVMIEIFRIFMPNISPQSAALQENEMRLLKIDQVFLSEYATITLPQLAENLSLSKNHTCRLIKEHYGKTFIEMRTSARLNAAADQLSRTKKPIAAISEQCGFSNPIYFTTEFKQQFHMTPRDYRKKHLREVTGDVSD